ncbi:MAG: RNA polymerase sporulation sigma factor SigG [Clostridia bacterium]|nr:RNA polymerase sporulation sigma factor SigG [Clostridia bacterium]
MQQKVSICGVNTSELGVLSAERTDALLELAANGDARAREELISGNLKLVLSVIRRFSKRGEPADDLFQVGCIGLIKAIDNFDRSVGVRFSTYAVPMIIGELRRYLRDNNSVRVSRSTRDVAYKALALREKLLAESEKEPSVDEIAKRMDMKREDVVFALDAISDPISLFEPVYSDGGDTVCVMDQIGDDRCSDEDWTEGIALEQAISRLSERERRILTLRFYHGRTQTEVAKEVGISQAQISRLEKTAIEKIRRQI